MMFPVAIFPGVIFQEPAGQTDTVVRREMKKNQVHTFRVHVVSGSDLSPASVSYVLSAKTLVAAASSAGGDSLEFKVENYSIEAEGLKYHSKLAGAGKLEIGDTGLPTLLMENIRDPRFWYPLLTLYLPAEVKANEFVAEQALSAGVIFHGKGNVKEDRYDLAGSFDQGQDRLATFTLKWRVDRHGWVVGGDGTVRDAGGTTTFTVS